MEKVSFFLIKNKILNHNKTCLIIATKIEAQSLFKSNHFNKIWNNASSSFYRGAKQDLLITGIGPICTAFACGKIVDFGHSQWLNLGIAGDLSQNHNINDIVQIGTCENWPGKNPLCRNLDVINFDDGEKLITVSNPIHDTATRDKCAKLGQLVDMEGYAISLCAKLSNKKLGMRKIVSDHADGANKKDLVASIPKLMKHLFESELEDFKK